MTTSEQFESIPIKPIYQQAEPNEPIGLGTSMVTLPEYEGGDYDASAFSVEREAWDHEHCNACGNHIPSMTLCHVTKRGRYIILCESCYLRACLKSALGRFEMEQLVYAA
jgi:hypothetical protein